ncbi:MAG TPA: M56 family metallopeptidase, partial [Holophaga sp.]|nr:M56 family metallopeptidase [Holophaga sp.]
MIRLAGTPFVQALGWAFVHSLWQGALLGLLAWAGLRLLRGRSPEARYALAGAALALMPLAALCTLALAWPSPLPAGPAMEGPRAATWREALAPLLPYASAFWLAGTAVMALRLLGGWCWVQRLRFSSVEAAPEALARRCADLARSMGLDRPVALLRSWSAEVPMVIGWIRPVILVPAAALANLDPAALEAVIAHELAHVRRRDYLWNILQSAVEALFFYHPATWWISRQIRAERENCCDDAAVSACGDRLLYARALAALEELRLPLESSPGLAPAATGGYLMNRIRRIVLPALPPSPLGRAGLLSLLAVTALGAATGLGLAQDKPAPEAPKAEPKVVTVRNTVKIDHADLERKAKDLEASAEALRKKAETLRKSTVKTDAELERLQKDLQEKARAMAEEVRKSVKVRLPRIEIDGRTVEIPDADLIKGELERKDGETHVFLRHQGEDGTWTETLPAAPGEHKLIVVKTGKGEGAPGTRVERHVTIHRTAEGETVTEETGPGHAKVIIRKAGKGSEVEELRAEIARLKARLDKLAPLPALPAPPAPPEAPKAPKAPKAPEAPAAPAA